MSLPPHFYLEEVAQISGKYLREMEHLRRSNTFQRQQPHVRRRRTWGYRGATSSTWQTTLRNLSFACVFPLRRGKLRALTFLYLGECKGENLSQHQRINAGERENLVEVSFL